MNEVDFENLSAWEPTGELRFVLPGATTTMGPILQSMWFDRMSDERQWRNVMTVIDDKIWTDAETRVRAGKLA